MSHGCRHGGEGDIREEERGRGEVMGESVDGRGQEERRGGSQGRGGGQGEGAGRRGDTVDAGRW